MAFNVALIMWADSDTLAVPDGPAARDGVTETGLHSEHFQSTKSIRGDSVNRNGAPFGALPKHKINTW